MIIKKKKNEKKKKKKEKKKKRESFIWKGLSILQKLTHKISF